MIIQLSNPIEMTTPLGEGLCLFTWEATSMCWYGVVQNETGEMWWWANHLVRIGMNISEMRYHQSPIHLSEKAKKALEPHLKRNAASQRK